MSTPIYYITENNVINIRISLNQTEMSDFRDKCARKQAISDLLVAAGVSDVVFTKQDEIILTTYGIISAMGITETDITTKITAIDSNFVLLSVNV